MKLIRKQDNVPQLCSQDDVRDPIVPVKLFTPWSSWTWFIIEHDPKDHLAFGYSYDSTQRECAELGYISIAQLESITGPFGLKIERDIMWTPKPLSQAKATLS